MQYLQTYLNRIRKRGNDALADSVLKTADEVGRKYLETFSFVDHEIGLLMGNIQSGKTGQMFGILCRAADLGFPVFLILSTDNVVLQQQTLERVHDDLDGFCICGENDGQVFTDNNLEKPVIIVLKKNYRVLRQWANILNSTSFMLGNPLFVFDDEADAASLNTKINQKDQSSINKYLDDIKSGASSSIYLQVTGTPQGPLLQTMASGWHPYFIYYFHPGANYLGGDFFFPADRAPECIAFTDDMKNVVGEAVLRHLMVSAQILGTGGKVCNCLFHPSIRKAAHKKTAEKVESVIAELKQKPDKLNKYVNDQYEDLAPVKSKKLSKNQLADEAHKLLDSVKVLILNSENDVKSSEYAEGCNFVVGGNTLGRGVTFPMLETISYTRTSKNPQADTMWQHSRMFGYDRDAGMMRVYIDRHLYKLFSDINATNNAIIRQIEKGMDDIKIYYPKGLKPTRKSVVDCSAVETITGGTNYYPFDPDNDDIEAISQLLNPFDGKGSYKVNMRLILKILKHIIPSPDFNLNAYLEILESMASSDPQMQGELIVRRGRNVTQGTGALLSPNDWKLGQSMPGKVVLTMYQIKNKNGWRRKNLWIPNINFPDGLIYYNVDQKK